MLGIECDQQLTVVGRLLTAIGNVPPTVAKCCQQHTDDCRLFIAAGDSERKVARGQII